MRTSALALCFFLTACASADRLIGTPSARKLPGGTVRAEYLFGSGPDATRLSYLDVGMGRFFDLEMRSEKFGRTPESWAFDFTYNIVSPLPGISPGFAAGMLDVSNNARDGRRPFVCTTFRDAFQTINGDVNSELTLGLFLAGRVPGFIGVSIPFSREFRFISDIDGVRWNVGFEYRPFREGAIRFINRDRETLLSLSLTKRF